jgi:hypothetical protein
MTKILNIAELARRMGKSRHWFYQRLNNNIVNGKPAEFTAEERGQIVDILHEIRYEIRDVIILFSGTSPIE